MVGFIVSHPPTEVAIALLPISYCEEVVCWKSPTWVATTIVPISIAKKSCAN